MRIVIKKLLGVFLVIIGLAALLTPLTPGSWLALIGLELLGLRLLIEKKFLKDKHKAAIAEFMKKFGFRVSSKPPDDKKQSQ
jgi:hypothetical protein